MKYLNNVFEADNGKLKQLIRPVRGFKTLKTAYATIKGFEVMRALRKGQAGAFNISRDVRGEARLIERAFGLGPYALSEAVRFINQNLELQAAWRRQQCRSLSPCAHQNLQHLWTPPSEQGESVGNRGAQVGCCHLSGLWCGRHLPRARMGVREPGPNQSRVLEAHRCKLASWPGLSTLAP